MSAIATIDCGYLAAVQAMADRIWADPIAKIDYTSYADAAKAVLENQRVNFSDITGPKDKSIILEWLQNCNQAVEVCSDACSNSGTDNSPICKTYELDLCRQVEFYVGTKSYRTRTIEGEESIAKSMLQAKKLLDEYIASVVIAGLVANAGTNQYTGGVGNVAGTTTTIAPQYWDAKLIAYLMLAAKMNKFTNPVMLDGANLFQVQALASAQTDKTAANLLGQFKYYSDPLNVESAAAGSTFLFNGNAAALVNKAYWPNGAANAMEREGGAVKLWSEGSLALPGIVYDIEYRDKCASEDWQHHFKVIWHGGFFLNPQPCDENITGILQFVCGNV